MGVLMLVFDIRTVFMGMVFHIVPMSMGMGMGMFVRMGMDRSVGMGVFMLMDVSMLMRMLCHDRPPPFIVKRRYCFDSCNCTISVLPVIPVVLQIPIL